MMTSRILISFGFTKTQKQRYLENETFCFLQIKKFINYTSRATLWQKSFVAEVTFNVRYHDWDQVQCLWTGMALNEFFFFFECLYFSENDIRTLLFVFWLRNRPFIKYVRNCTGAYRYWEVEKSVTRYVRTKSITRNKCCGIFFVYWFGQVHKSITTSKKNVVIFFHHNYDCFILCNN